MKTDVFLLVFDSLRRDYIEPYSDRVSTPALARLARDSYVLERAYSTGSWTIPAHGSLFTGQYPSEHGATGAQKRLPTGPTTLAEIAAQSHYEPIAVSTNPWLTPNFGFGRGFGEHSEYFCSSLPFPDVDDPKATVSGGQGFVRDLRDTLRWASEQNTIKRLANAAYRRFLIENELKTKDATEVTDHLLSAINKSPDQRPVFAFANYMDPHEPYFQDNRESQVAWNLRSVGNPPKIDPDEIRDTYAASVSALDEGVGELIDGLKKQGRYEDALIVAVSDHGQSLGEHGYWGHGTYLYDELLHVPAFVKPPRGCEPSVISRIFSLREAFDIATAAFNGSLDLERRLRNEPEDVIIAESSGPHMDVKLGSDKVSKRGYWKFYGNTWSAEKDLDTGELTVSLESSNMPTPEMEIRDQVEKAISRYDLTVTTATAAEEGFDSEVEQRLKHLGYK